MALPISLTSYMCLSLLLYVFGNLSYHAHAISVISSVHQYLLESGLEALHRLSTLYCADVMQGFEASGVMTKDVKLAVVSSTCI